MNVVLDTSIYVSSLLKKQGVPAQVLDAWRAQRFQVITSPAIVEEIRTAMTYDRIRKRYSITDEDVQQLLDLLTSRAIVVPGVADVRDAGVRDPKTKSSWPALLNPVRTLSCRAIRISWCSNAIGVPRS